MTYAFDVDHAQKYGLDEAVMLYNILYWTKQNTANNNNFHDGRYWTYNSARAFSELFPFWNEDKVRRILLSLEKQGAILSGVYNKAAYDRTKWYTAADSIMQSYDTHSAELQDQFRKVSAPIPDVNTVSKPDVNIGADAPKKRTRKADEVMDTAVDKYTARHMSTVGGEPILNGSDKATLKKMLVQYGDRLDDILDRWFRDQWGIRTGFTVFQLQRNLARLVMEAPRKVKTEFPIVDESGKVH